MDQVQRAATALDRTDAICVTGQGVAARTSYRVAQPLARKARESLAALPRLVAGYRGSLRALGQASVAVDGAPRQALAAVVRDGEAEAAAVARFRAAAAALWPQYDQLAADEDVWITRAVTPWYRTAQEGAAAYTILVEDTRPALQKARVDLGAAAQAVSGPSLAQSVTLAAADKALAGLRTPA